MERLTVDKPVCDGEDYENIIAWMPLPEPYSQGRSNT